ncbi:MAG: hypothetical protein [Caudoviricetes sp.]|nr:MAG: hypothetical protein [Caudoviricetes sp.]
MDSMIKVEHFENGVPSVGMSVNRISYIVSWGMDVVSYPRNGLGIIQANHAFDNYVTMAKEEEQRIIIQCREETVSDSKRIFEQLKKDMGL